MKSHWHWGTRIAIVYSIFATSTIGFVVFAMTRDVDLVSPDYYAASISYDSRQAAAERALHLPATVAIVGQAAKDRRLSVSFPLTARPDSAALTLYRASDSRADRTVPIDVKSIDEGGRLGIALDALPSGPWIVQLTWTSATRTYYVEHRVVVQ